LASGTVPSSDSCADPRSLPVARLTKEPNTATSSSLACAHNPCSLNTIDEADWASCSNRRGTCLGPRSQTQRRSTFAWQVQRRHHPCQVTSGRRGQHELSQGGVHTGAVTRPPADENMSSLTGGSILASSTTGGTAARTVSTGLQQTSQSLAKSLYTDIKARISTCP
jgi:hypothetical protein